VVPAAGGEPRQLTRGATDENSIDWRGDGHEIVFLSNHEPDPDAKLNYDIFAVNVSTGAVRQLTHTPGVEFNPAISPDGRFIAYTATTRDITTIDSIAEDVHVWAVPVTGGTGQELNAALDRRGFLPHWTVDSRFIIYTAADHGKLALYRVPRNGGASTALFNGEAQVSSISVAKNGAILAVVANPTMPPEIFRLDTNPPQQLTHLNTIRRKLSKPQTVNFRSFDGTPIEGWFYPPLVTPSSGRIPMILTIHGGPHEGMFGYRFQPAIEAYAARGYATLAINPRGTTGYGQKFTDGCLGDWGGGDYKDLMAGVDYILKTHPEIDPERLGVTGASYGGFMTNWVVTQTARFKAAVAVSSLSDLISFYATSLYQDLIHADFGGFPWDDDHYALLWKWSPLAHIKNATTPTLLLHGEQDNDVHITQAEEMYTALRRRGVPAELVRYPREGHGFHEPKHRADAVARTLAWMDRFLK
jgi:dipeptidyl aminopeptidase/acylaminoacyl peptidase